MTLSRLVEDTLQRVPGLRERGDELAQAIHQAVLSGGKPTRKIADLLHGTWLGHPLHPVLTDFVIGAWGFGVLFDVLALAGGDRFAQRMGNTLAKAGTLAAVPTMLSGLADFSTIPRSATCAATMHAVLNDINFSLYLLSLRARGRGRYRRGVMFSLLGMALMGAAAWLGGHLVYGLKVGVDHSEAEGPEAWTPALAASELAEGQPKRVEVEGNPVLLYRGGGTVYAVGAVCSHAGAPLEAGTFDDCTVQCPWHDSVFDLRTGAVEHGPATRPQPRFAVREREGQIEVRLVAS